MIIDTPTHRTKTTSAHQVYSVASLVANGDQANSRVEDAYQYPVGESRITYERGPQRLNMAGKVVNHWKACRHTKALSSQGVECNFRHEIWNNSLHFAQTYAAYTVPVVRWSSFGLYSNFARLPAPVVVDELMHEVYADIAGHARDSLLLLEDFAGFFSGKSLWKGIRGVANATEGVARSISTARKLGRAFGWKNSLYNMWLSSKEAVRQVIGLRLGYRFSFKTTLNDIAQAVDFGYGFGQYLQQMQRRNTGRVLRYEKTDQNTNTVTEVLSPSQVMAKMFASAPRMHYKQWFYQPVNAPASFYGELPGGIIQRRAGYKAKAWAYASVRYPMEYLTMKHYLEGRFGLDKPLTTLWAIVPLSFVVDYLFNVQDALTYLDNKLNDYLVATTVEKVWTANTVFRSNTLDIPGKTIPYSFAGNPDYRGVVTLPHIKTSVTDSLDYQRYPASTNSISASLPPLIGADETNWTTRIGTGLELLSQTRLR